AGLGYGGSCFPKDVKALEHMALVHGSHPSLLRAVMDINRDARRWAVFTLRKLLEGKLDQKRIGIMGLAFKPNTDDIRESPAMDIARMLQNEGAHVVAYDPVAMPTALRDNPTLNMAEDTYDLAKDVDALLVCTEWNEFKQVDLARLKQSMARPIVVDGRNMYDVDVMQKFGFIYRAVGKGNLSEEEEYASTTAQNGHYSAPSSYQNGKSSTETNGSEQPEALQENAG
ncbi:MAG: UDP-glucose/GDP-mannose dehydrogenase family protein, partial [Caldilineaceae bacterium]|nr:UDP-glucose/GDP-mannose dehydrogenase family protein [Caldilineaceae bacterium]